MAKDRYYYGIMYVLDRFDRMKKGIDIMALDFNDIIKISYAAKSSSSPLDILQQQSGINKDIKEGNMINIWNKNESARENE